VFGLFKKDPLKTLQDEYAKRLEQARDLQRNGDIKGFAELSAQADELLKQLESLEAERGDAAN
jgi:hypothetical protein